jgi:hypothetical protein
MRKITCLFALLLLSASLRAQDARQIVQQAVDTEIAANRSDHSHWLYREVNKQPAKSVTQWVAQTSRGEIKRVVMRNGVEVPLDQQRSTVMSFINDTNALAKQRRTGSSDDKKAETFMRQFPVGFQWEIVSRDGNSIRLHYKPDPNYDPPTREARVLAAMEGNMTVHATQHRIMALDGKLTDDVTFGYGLFGRLYKGGSFSVQREELAPNIWQITKSTTHIQGHALIFKTISEQEDDTKSDFERLPDDITLDKAAEMVMAKPE